MDFMQFCQMKYEKFRNQYMFSQVLGIFVEVTFTCGLLNLFIVHDRGNKIRDLEVGFKLIIIV